MVAESTVICVDDSEYMRNGDFLPNRLQAQEDAVGIVCQSKTQSNPENNVGLLTMAGPQVLNTLTTDVARLLSKLHQVQPKGNINFITGVRIAHLVLKHRQGKQNKMRIVVFVGSPLEIKTTDLVSLAKSLKKEKVSVDVVNFGEVDANTEKLESFISTLNGEEGTGSHLVTIPTGRDTQLSDALVSSPVVQGEDGMVIGPSGSGGFEFGIDPNDDPELVLALRVSMEEQRQRQEEARRAGADSVPRDASMTPQLPPVDEVAGVSSEERLLERALAMSMETDPAPATAKSTTPNIFPDIAAMTEEEQFAFAVQMSMQQQAKSPDDVVTELPAAAAREGGKTDECKKKEQEKKEEEVKKEEQVKEEQEKKEEQVKKEELGKKEEQEKKEDENKQAGTEEKGEYENKEETAKKGKSEESNK